MAEAQKLKLKVLLFFFCLSILDQNIFQCLICHNYHRLFDLKYDYIIEKEENKLRLTNDIDEESIDGTLVFDDLNSQVSDGVSEIPESAFD